MFLLSIIFIIPERHGEGLEEIFLCGDQNLLMVSK